MSTGKGQAGEDSAQTEGKNVSEEVVVLLGGTPWVGNVRLLLPFLWLRQAT